VAYRFRRPPNDKLLSPHALPPRPSTSTSAQEERQRLLLCCENLAARGRLRWHEALESGAILCEELCDDRLALAGSSE
jgi:hypothetical protein